MIWIAIIGVILYTVGVVVRDAHMSPEKIWVPFGSITASIGLALFAFLLIISIIGGIRTL